VRADAGGVRAGVGLGQAERSEDLAGGQRPQPALALGLVAEQQQRQRADGEVGLPGGGDGLVGLGHLVQGGDGADGGQAGAALLGRDEQAHEVELGHLAEELGGEALLVPPACSVGRDLGRRELAAEVADGRLLGGQLISCGQHLAPFVEVGGRAQNLDRPIGLRYARSYGVGKRPRRASPCGVRRSV
jgi:hypothetical protein